MRDKARRSIPRGRRSKISRIRRKIKRIKFRESKSFEVYRVRVMASDFKRKNGKDSVRSRKEFYGACLDTGAQKISNWIEPSESILKAYWINFLPSTINLHFQIWWRKLQFIRKNCYPYTISRWIFHTNLSWCSEGRCTSTYRTGHTRQRKADREQCRRQVGQYNDGLGNSDHPEFWTPLRHLAKQHRSLYISWTTQTSSPFPTPFKWKTNGPPETLQTWWCGWENDEAPRRNIIIMQYMPRILSTPSTIQSISTTRWNSLQQSCCPRSNVARRKGCAPRRRYSNKFW